MSGQIVPRSIRRWLPWAAIATLGWAQQAAAACTVLPFLQLPVTIVGGKPMVTATVNGKETPFIVDSGAFYSVISPGAAAELKLPLSPAPANLHVSGVGGVTESSFATVNAFVLGNVTLPATRFIVGGSEVGAAGLLGQNVLGSADADYDLAAASVRLMRPFNCTTSDVLPDWAAALDTSRLDLVPLPGFGTHALAEVSVNGQKMRAVFDTGSAVTVLSLAAAARVGIKPGMPGVIRAGMSRGVGSALATTWIATFAELRVGKERFHNVRLAFTDLATDKLDMLVGLDFFLTHRIYVANSQNRLYIAANAAAAASPPGASAALPAGVPSGIPSDADGLTREASVLSARGMVAQALSDEDRAVQLAPKDPRFLVERANLRLKQRQIFLAMDDYQAALRLKPDFVPALLGRGQLRLLGAQTQDALADLDQVDHALPNEADARFALGELFTRANAGDRSIRQYSLWIDAHPQDSRLPLALNARCWERASLNQALDGALADCNAALARLPQSPEIMDSRGLVHLRRKEWDAAIADYQAALAINPRLAWSLFGRGLARIGKGDAAGGQADQAAALAIQPLLIVQARQMGLVGGTGASPSHP